MIEILNEAVVEGFVNSVLARGFDERCPTPDVHREWWSLCTGKDRFVAIAAPRGFAKSTAITHSYTLTCLLFRERKFALIISDTETQAVLFLQDLKKELLDNEDIIKLFCLKVDGDGKVVLFKDTESDFIVEFTDGYKFRVMAKGSEQKVRGLKWGHQRPDLIVCDDLENDEIVMNKDRREKFRKWFYGALLPCRSDDGIVRVVGTILHMDSLLERLMPENQLNTKNKRKHLVRLELKEYTDLKLPWKSVKYRAHNPDFSALLWAEKKPQDELRRIRDDYLAQNMPEVYSQEFLNVPIDETNSYFKRADFLKMKEDEKSFSKKYYITGDLAISEDERADWTCFVVGGLDSNGILYIVHVIRLRMDGKEIVDTLMRLQQRYQPEVIGLEKGQIQKAIKSFLTETMIRSGKYMNIMEIAAHNDKMSRARSIQGRMRAGGVKFDMDSDWYPTMFDECMRFPRDKHDDQVDALAYQGLLLDKMVDALTPKEQDDEDFANELAKDNWFNPEGRSLVGGY